MSLKFNAFTGTFDNTGIKPTINESVNTFANLPSAASNSGKIILVKTGTGVWPLNKKSGLYISDGSSWNQTGLTPALIQSQLDLEKAKLGFIFVADNQYTTGNPLTISANTRTKITNNTLGVNLNANKPSGIDMWNPSTNSLQGIGQNDTYGLRFRCAADPSLNNRNFTIEVEINSPTNAIVYSKTVRLARGAGVNTLISEQIELFSGVNYQANGASIYVTCDGDVDVSAISFFIEKRRDG